MRLTKSSKKPKDKRFICIFNVDLDFFQYDYLYSNNLGGCHDIFRFSIIAISLGI